MGFGKDHKGVILREKQSQALGTLAANTAVLAEGPNIEEDFRVMKSEVYAVVTGLTAAQGAGLLLGMSNGRLTIAEIAECLNMAGPLGPSDRVRTEFAERQCHIIGALRIPDIAETEAVFEDGVTRGQKMVDKFPWTYTDTDGWDFFVWNPSGAGLTTGATMHLQATHFGVWVL